MAVYLDLATRFDEASAEKAAKDVMEKFVDAAKDINGAVGGILGKMFDGIDGAHARNELKSIQDEYAKTARAAADAERMSVSSAGNVEVAIKRLHDAHDKYGASAAQTALAENRLTNAWALSSQAALDSAAANDAATASHARLAAGATGVNSSMLLAAGGVAAVTLAVGEATKKLFDMGQQWADISDKITFTTGKIGADAAAMTDQIAKIGDKTAAPLESIGTVYAQLTRLKDLQGETLNDLTKQVADYDQMATKVGADPLNLGTFTRLMQEFNVPANQVAADLNTIVGAAQDGQVPINELVSTLQTAGPTADLVGLSFGQLTNVISALDESGVNVDRTLTGLSLGLKNIVKDAPALQKLIKFTPDENSLQRLKDVIQKIQDLEKAGDDMGAKDLGATAFGKSWAAISDDILRGKLNVDTLNTSIDATPDKIESMREHTRHFGDDWQQVKNQIVDALKPLSEPVFDALDSGLKGFEEKLQEFNDRGGIEHYLHGFGGNDSAFGRVWHKLFGGDPGSDLSPGSNPDDSGSGHGGDSGREHRGLTAPGSAPPGPNIPSGPGAPTAPNRDTSAPYYPLDLNPADKPGGYESMDQWISSQKAVRSALDHQHDTGEAIAAAQQKLADLQDSGKATQEQLNAASEALSKSERDNKQATDDVADAKRKYVEDANKRPKGKDPNGNYDPFTEATKHSTGLIPQLASLMGAFFANEALGNPFGKMQAAKKGEDPSNPLYVADVNGAKDSGGGLPGAISNFFRQQATGQAPQPDAGDLPPTNAPPGSIPQIVTQGPGAPSGSPSGAPSSAPSGGARSPGMPASPGYGQHWEDGKGWVADTAATSASPSVAPSGATAPGDSPLVSALKAKGSFSPEQIRLIQAFGKVEGLNPAGNPTLGFNDAQLGGDSSLEGHVNALAKQFKDRAPVSGAFPEGGSDEQQAQWIAKVVGQPLHGINPPDTGDYVGRIVGDLQGASPANKATAAGASNMPSAGGLNLSTIPVAAQKYANDCIDASARIILSHSGVNMTEDQLEGVIAPGGSIDSQAAGLNKLDPQGKFAAMQGSGGSMQAMFNAIKASIDNGTGSILNVAPGSSLAGHTFAPGHFIAATGYNPDGTINVSDTAGGRNYSVSEEDAFQATRGRGIVAGTGIGPQNQPGAGPGPGPGQPGVGARPGLPGDLGKIFGPQPAAGPGVPLQLPGFGSGGSTLGDAAGHPIASSDTQPALLTPGEFVVKRDVAQKHMGELQAMNSGHDDPHKPEDPSKPTADRATTNSPGPASSSRKDSSSVTPPPPGPRIGAGTGPGFGIGGGIIGAAEQAAVMAAMAAAAMADGGVVGYAGGGPVLGFAGGDLVPTAPGGIGEVGAGTNIGASAPAPGTPAVPGGGGGSPGGGAPKGGSGDPMTAVLNRTVGYIGQLTGIAAQGLMSSLIPGASQKGGIMDGGILAKLAGGIAGAHPSAPNTAGNTPTPLASSVKQSGDGDGGGTTNHIGMQAGVNIGTLINQNGQSGHDLANDLAFKSYAGYGSR